MNAHTELEPDSIEIDTPLCELCGYAIEDLEELIHLRAADPVAQWERADPRDAWRHTGEHPPRSTGSDAVPVPQPQSYRTAASTIEAFKFVVSLGEPERLEAWLLNHPQDATTLLKLLEAT